MPHPASPRVEGAKVGLIVGTAVVVVWLGLASLMPKAVHSASIARAMTVAEMKSELGEYDQKVDCAAMGAPAGWQGYVWVKTNLAGRPIAAWFLCQP